MLPTSAEPRLDATALDQGSSESDEVQSREGDAALLSALETAADRRDYPWLPSGSELDSAPSNQLVGVP